MVPEAKTKLCHLGFSGNAFVLCRADECMAWQVLQSAGEIIHLYATDEVPDGFEVFGTEIEGVQLSQLSEAGLDELALFAAKRGALVFRNQDFRDIGFEAQKKIVRHFGPLHIHGWAPHPMAGSEEHMIIYDHKE